MNTISIHNVDTLELKYVKLSDFYTLDIDVIDEKGNHTHISLFSEKFENLKVDSIKLGGMERCHIMME